MKILGVVVLAYHLVAVMICVIAVAFPNILKRYDKYSAELVAQIPHEEVVFKSRRATDLHGWLFSNTNSDKAILLCHGRSRNKSHEMPYVRDFLKYYNVFVFDFAGHGENPYSTTSIGYHESEDVLGAVNWLGNRGFAQIAIMGHSMGGAAAIKAVAEYGSGPVKIEVVITEGAFAELDDLLRGQTKKFLLPTTVWWPAFRIAERLGDYRIRENLPESFIRNVRCPVLVMQADKESLAPAGSAKRLVANAGGPSEIVEFKGKHDVPCDEVSSNALRFLLVHLQPQS